MAVPILKNPFGGFSAAQQASPYLVYDLRTRILWDNGQLQLPVAYVTNLQQAVQNPTTQVLSARPAAANIQVSAPYGWKVVTFHIVRAGAPPVAPDPAAIDANSILRFFDVEDIAPTIAVDGLTYLYGMNGTYLYSLTRPVWVKDTRSIGTTPADASLGHTVTGNQFVSGLL